jgi:hypothetical protein
MSLEKKYIQTSNPYNPIGSDTKITRTIYYGEVISINDSTDGGMIKVRIDGLDNNVSNDKLVWAYPMMPKFFHLYPKTGEVVRVLIEDLHYPQRSRFWLGPVISQPHKMWFDSIYTALSTTNMGVIKPDKAPSTHPDAKGVYPEKEDIAILGRKNNDIVLKKNETYIRTGKHFNDNNLKLNVKNPASFSQHFEEEGGGFVSKTIIISDKVAILSHAGKPKFKAANITQEDRNKIFEKGHPIPRGDVLVEALKKIRNAIILHVHGYASIPPDKDMIISDLEKIDFDSILQKNIIIN